MHSVSGHRPLLRAVVLSLVLVALAAALTGCVRVDARMSVSTDYKVSGTIVTASIPTSAADKGPQLAIPADLGDQVLIQPYAADGYLGSQLSFSGLDFGQLNALVNGSSPTPGRYALSLRRVGDLVAFSGSVDLTRVPADHCDVRISISLPGTVSSATGEVADDTVSWRPKPGMVTSLAASADLSTLSTAEWVRWSVLVAGLLVIAVLAVTGLALIAHRRSARARARGRR
jgi:Protein of unknown function (DUF3153)